MRRATLVLLLLAGCAATPRDNASNACNFMFLSGLPIPYGVVVGAAACSFGPELIPDTEEDDGND